jgi:hypothetical protein
MRWLNRLVLLAADEDYAVGFDVRSLQELMAGRALINGAETDPKHNLTIASRSPHLAQCLVVRSRGDVHEKSI